MPKQTIGIDVGHSAVKVAPGGEDAFLFPSAATPAVDLSVDSASTSAKGDTVRVDSDKYFVGETALIHTGGSASEGLRDNWLHSKEYAALLTAGFEKAKKILGTDDVILSLGLPSRLHATQKEDLRTFASSSLMVPKKDIYVMPQPLAAYYARVLDHDGRPAKNVDENEKWLIIDVGYYTTDFGIVDHGIWSAAGQESMPGTHVAAQTLKRIINDEHDMDVGLRKAEEVLRVQTIRDQGEVIDMSKAVSRAVESVAESIINRAVQVFGDAAIRDTHGVFVAGGGSALLFDAIKDTWKHAVCAQEPRMAVARGLRRYAAATALLKDKSGSTSSKAEPKATEA